jgi:membrane protein implicated in regulation of membrane protease activity
MYWQSRTPFIAFGLATVLGLSGCLLVDADLDVNEYQELDIQIVGAIHEDVATAVAAREIVADGFSGEGFDRSNYASGPWNGYRFTKDNADAVNWSVTQANGDYLRLSDSGGSLRFEGRYSLVGDLPAEYRSLVDVRFTLSHTGTVLSTNGNQVSPTRIQWVGAWGSVMDMNALVETEPGPPQALPETEPGTTKPAEESDNTVETEPAEDAPDAVPDSELISSGPLEVDAGLVGIATTSITPEAGQIAVGGALYQARSITGLIEAGTEVEIIAYDNGVVIVEAVQSGLSALTMTGIGVGVFVILSAVTMTILLRHRRSRRAGETAQKELA